MPSLGAGELAVVAIVGFFALGPERLPVVARRMGEVVAAARRVVADVRAEVHAAIDDHPGTAP